MVEIFKTNVENGEQADIILASLYSQIHFIEINFDLEDCDRILRIKGDEFCCINIIQILKDNGFECFLLK
ncbi:hypothetical protein SAMN05216464_101659 [Mucilaginibacter pineti]|uniref:Uncharacterized protein n=1 Tax=Mucilaginibacter pineti TaxID=1391627 RepID=A0A1G6UIE9_9SPHI|nr:hypothetical protein SAMN05216464_101659 [Mucilaginibacter pineti]